MKINFTKIKVLFIRKTNIIDENITFKPPTIHCKYMHRQQQNKNYVCYFTKKNNNK